MNTYVIQVTDDDTLEVQARSEDEARKKVKALIAERSVVPQADNIFFDYDTGVKDMGLRFELGLAEASKPEEQELVLARHVGNQYTRDSNNNLALTPEGMKRLGLEDYIKTITLTNGQKIQQNTIIDESFEASNFGFNRYDFADLSGAIGPVFGSVLALIPQLRVAKAAASLLRNSNVAGNVLASGLGGALGKGVEEAYEVQEGIQAQNRDELAALLGTEFTLGAVGQGLGEAVFKFYSLLLGKQAPFDNLRFQQQAIKGRSILDIMKLDERLGKEATEKQIAKAVRDGEVGLNEFKALPSQSALNRVIAGRLQAVSETVLGNKRVLKTKEYLREEIDRLNRLINGENFAGEEFVTEATRGQIKESLDKARLKLSSAEIETSKEVNKLVEELIEGITSADDFTTAIGRDEIGNLLIRSLQDVRKGVTEQLNERYKQVDEMLFNIVSDEDPVIAEGIARAINQNIAETLDDMVRLIDDRYARAPLEAATKAPKDVDDYASDSLMRLRENLFSRSARIKEGLETDNFLEYWQTVGRNPSERNQLRFGENFQRLRNDLSTLRALRQYSTNVGINTSLIDEISKKIYNPVADGLEEKFGLFQLMEDPRQLVKLKQKGGVITYADKGLDRAARTKLSNAFKQLGELNDEARKRMEPFDSLKIKQIIGEAPMGNYNIDSVYDEFVLSASKDPKPFLDFFKGLRQHEEYLKKIHTKDGKLNEVAFQKAMNKFGGEQYVKTQLQRKILHDAWKSAYNKTDESFDFRKFAREVKKFDRLQDKKMEIIFGGNFKQVVDALDQLEMLTPSVYKNQPLELERIVNEIARSEMGLADGNNAKVFFDTMLRKAADTRDRIAFDQNAIIRRLDVSGTDEIADVVFKPNSAENINLVKEAVDENTFKEIQQASLSKLLKDTFDPSKEKITDIFRPDRLRRTLDSYGDSTLEAMFGRESLLGMRALQRALDAIVIEKSAGTLVAAGIAVNALSIGMLPTVAGLALMRQAFSSPFILNILARKDPGAKARALQFFIRAARQQGIRLITEGYSSAVDATGEAIEAGKERLRDEVSEDELKGFQDDLEQFRRESQRGLRNLQSSTPLPEVQPISSNALSPERIDFAERLARRPIV